MKEKDDSQTLFIIGVILLIITAITILYRSLELFQISIIVMLIGSFFILLSTLFIYREKRTPFSIAGLILSILGIILLIYAFSFNFFDIGSGSIYFSIHPGISLLILSYNVSTFQKINYQTIGIYLLATAHSWIRIFGVIIAFTFYGLFWNFLYLLYVFIIPVSLLVTLYYKNIPNKTINLILEAEEIEPQTTEEIEKQEKLEKYGKDSFQLSILSIFINPLPLTIFGLSGFCLGFTLSPIIIITAFVLGIYSRNTNSGRWGVFYSSISGVFYLLILINFILNPPFY